MITNLLLLFCSTINKIQRYFQNFFPFFKLESLEEKKIIVLIVFVFSFVIFIKLRSYS